MYLIRKICLLLCACIFAQAGYSATVTKIRKKKKLVYIDQGEEAGVKKGMKVCFKDTDGKKITCGKVRKVKKSYSKVKVRSKKKIKKIVKGGDAEVIGLATSGEAPVTAEAGGEQGSATGAKFMAIRALYLPSIFSPTVYNKIIYLAPEAAEADETLWDKGDQSKLSIAAFALEFEFLPIDLALGFRVFRGYQEFQVSADYDRANRDLFVSSIMKGNSFGSYLDYYIMSPRGMASGLRLGVGLDVDISKVDLIVSKVDEDETDGQDSSGEIYRASSAQSVISLRIPVSYEINVGSFGVDLGINILVPVYEAKAKLDSVISDPNIKEYELADEDENLAAAEEDLLKSMAHGKASFGLEVLIGTYFAF